MIKLLKSTTAKQAVGLEFIENIFKNISNDKMLIGLNEDIKNLINSPNINTKNNIQDILLSTVVNDETNIIKDLRKNIGNLYDKMLNEQAVPNTATFNRHTMDAEIESILYIISKYYNIKSLDPGNFSNIKITLALDSGSSMDMNFIVHQYEIKEYGNLSIMMTDGIQQMYSVILTPYYKNLPLISTDYIFTGDSRISYIEFYGFNAYDNQDMPIFNSLKSLEEKYKKYTDTIPSPGWFDKIRTMGLFKKSNYQDNTAISQMLYDSIDITMKASIELPKLNQNEYSVKYKLIQDYVNKLIDEPGISTAHFKKYLGQEGISQFFNKVFFGTELYKN